MRPFPPPNKMASEIGHQKAEGRIIFQSERIVEPEAATDVVLSVARMGALPPVRSARSPRAPLGSQAKFVPCVPCRGSSGPTGGSKSGTPCAAPAPSSTLGRNPRRMTARSR